MNIKIKITRIKIINDIYINIYVK